MVDDEESVVLNFSALVLEAYQLQAVFSMSAGCITDAATFSTSKPLRTNHWSVREVSVLIPSVQVQTCVAYI